MNQKHEILLVEDDQSHISLIKKGFERSNGRFLVVFAHSLGEAKAYLTEHEPELIIADIRLPDGGGDELLGGKKPVVLMSSGGDEDSAAEMKKAGAIDYIVKSADAFSDIANHAERAMQQWKAKMHIVHDDRDKLAERLERKSKELEHILYVISHDLGSPLLSIRAFTHELKRVCREIEKCTEKAEDDAVRVKVKNLIQKDVEECLDYIRLSTDEIGWMVEELKQLSRAGRVHLDIKPLNMEKIVSEEAEDMKAQIEKENIKFEVGGLPYCVGDEVQIRRVFDSLLTNAATHIENGRQGIVRVTGEKKGDMAIYVVEDNGSGMKPEEKERIFEIFYRSDGQRNDGGEQEHAGLALLREILGRQKGRIWVESELGRGSAFYIVLPAA